jgi:hypothetical protein
VPIVDWKRVPSVGYTGFDVAVSGTEYLIYGGALRVNVPAPKPYTTIDEFLFDTNARALYDQYGLQIDVVQARVAHRIRGLPGPCPVLGPLCGTMEFSSPSIWEDPKFVIENACYNYANNVLTPNRVYPQTELPHHGAWTPEQIHRALTRDGLRFLGYELPRRCPRDASAHYLAALLHTPGRAGDYHFLRLDRNGLWSHKNGVANPTNLANQQLIRDLCTAEFKSVIPYLFAGFFESNAEAQANLAARGKNQDHR